MPKPFPKEFRADVIAVARKGDQSIAQVARSFGISESCLARWLRIADRDDGMVTAILGRLAAAGGDLEREVRSCARRRSGWSRRTRSCAARRPTSPATSSQNDVPAGP